MKILIPFLFLLFTNQLFAFDKWLLDVPKDSYVVLKPHKSVFGFEKWSVWSGRNSYGATISELENKILINGDEDWRDSGWATMVQCILAKTDKKKDGVLVEVRCGNDNAKLTFDTSVKDLNKAFKEVVYVGSLSGFMTSPYYIQEVEKRFLPSIFKGKLEVIPLDIQRKLMTLVNYDSSWIGGEEFKGKFYLKLGGADTIIYNTIQVNQSQRTTKTVEKIIGFGIKETAKLKEFEGLDGLKIELKVFFKDFLRDANPSSEDLAVYFSFADLEKFQNADITNQQLIDSSIVLVNGNRVQVSMTQF